MRSGSRCPKRQDGGHNAAGYHPISLVPPAVLAAAVNPVPVLLHGLLVSALLVLMMTYAVMPRITRLFAACLYL